MKYTKPELEVVELDVVDVITSSGMLEDEVTGETPEVDPGVLPPGVSMMD